MNSKIQKLTKLNELLQANAFTREEFESSKNILFSKDEETLQQLMDAWDSFSAGNISHSEFEDIKKNFFQKSNTTVYLNTQTELSEVDKIKAQLEILKQKIDVINKISTSSDAVLQSRIIEAGNCTKSIYKAIVWQIIISIVFGILYKNPGILTSIKIDENNPSSYEIEKLSSYYLLLNFIFGLTGFIILSIILTNLKEIADNLINVTIPIKRQDQKMK